MWPHSIRVLEVWYSWASSLASLTTPWMVVVVLQLECGLDSGQVWDPSRWSPMQKTMWRGRQYCISGILAFRARGSCSTPCTLQCRPCPHQWADTGQRSYGFLSKRRRSTLNILSGSSGGCASRSLTYKSRKQGGCGPNQVAPHHWHFWTLICRQSSSYWQGSHRPLALVRACQSPLISLRQCGQIREP